MKVLKKILKFVVRGGTMLVDMFILLCIANVVMKTAMDLEIVEVGAWALGVIAALSAFVFIKFRHQLPFVEHVITQKTGLKPIHTEEAYQEGIRQMASMWDAVPGTYEGDQLEMLAILLDDYERNYRAPMTKMSLSVAPSPPTPEPMIEETPKKSKKDIN